MAANQTSASILLSQHFRARGHWFCWVCCRFPFPPRSLITYIHSCSTCIFSNVSLWANESCLVLFHVALLCMLWACSSTQPPCIKVVLGIFVAEWFVPICMEELSCTTWLPNLGVQRAHSMHYWRCGASTTITPATQSHVTLLVCTNTVVHVISTAFSGHHQTTWLPVPEVGTEA